MSRLHLHPHARVCFCLVATAASLLLAACGLPGANGAPSSTPVATATSTPEPLYAIEADGSYDVRTLEGLIHAPPIPGLIEEPATEANGLLVIAYVSDGATGKTMFGLDAGSFGALFYADRFTVSDTTTPSILAVPGVENWLMSQIIAAAAPGKSKLKMAIPVAPDDVQDLKDFSFYNSQGRVIAGEVKVDLLHFRTAVVYNPTQSNNLWADKLNLWSGPKEDEAHRYYAVADPSVNPPPLTVVVDLSKPCDPANVTGSPARYEGVVLVPSQPLPSTIPFHVAQGAPIASTDDSVFLSTGAVCFVAAGTDTSQHPWLVTVADNVATWGGAVVCIGALPQVTVLAQP